MAEKGGTKILAIITICVMLVTIGLSGCVGDDGKQKEKNEYKYYGNEYNSNYTLEIKCNSTYIIIVPFLSIDHLSEKKIFSSIKINGHILDYSIIQLTNKMKPYENISKISSLSGRKTNDYALLIVGSMDAIFQYYINTSSSGFLTLNSDLENSTYSVYTQTLDNCSISIMISSEIESKHYYWIFNEGKQFVNLRNGWNLINITGIGFFE
jgi:hypothetical protein